MMIQNYFDNVKRILGGLISMPAHRRVGPRAFTFFPFLKIGGSSVKRAMRAGKKK
jgi:hypothetical protein